MYVLEQYVQNIVRVGVDVSRANKLLKMRDVQGYPPAQKTFFKSQVIKKQLL